MQLYCACRKHNTAVTVLYTLLEMFMFIELIGTGAIKAVHAVRIMGPVAGDLNAGETRA